MPKLVWARERFWLWIQDQLKRPDAHAALSEVAQRVMTEHSTLLAAKPPASAGGNPDWVGGIRGEGQPQSFFLPWANGALTPVHAHPNRMLVVVVLGQLEVVNYGGDGHTATSTEILDPSQWVMGVGERVGFDHFPHHIRALSQSLSFHVYGDDPALGRRYETAAG